ncbi:hypothetical protein DMA11_04735 [Marinilabiliaceae bacterium JC017]|nr:hypothetical protein DMA11_04735 [Marinilabiliaceae bacterium JC017]
MLRLILLPVFILGMCVITVAQSSEKLIKDINTFDLLPTYNVWQYSSNPAGIFYHPNASLSETNIDFSHENGDYQRVFEPESKRSIAFQTQGYTLVKGIRFYGKLSYYNGLERNLKWNDVAFIAPDNPFILADSTGGDYDNEQFLLQGIIASQIGKSDFYWGLNLNYKAGSKADQTDPRPKITSMRAEISPGIILSKEHWQYGMNLHLEKFKEEIDIKVVDNYVNHRFFRFMGFGMYQGVTKSSLERIYKGENYGLALQLQYTNSSFSNILELKADKEYERAQEGAESTIYLSGDYKGFSMQLSDHLTVNRSNLYHTLSMYANYKTIKGIWFDQEQQTYEDGTKYWEVYNQSVKYKRSVINLHLGYDLLKMKEGTEDFRVGADVMLEALMSDFYPENYYENIFNLTTKVNGKKSWSLNNADISLKAGVGYRFPLKQEIYIENIELQDQITYPEHYYHSSELLSLNGEMKIGIPHFFNTNAIPYLAVNGNYLCALADYSKYNGSTRLLTSFKVGFIF